MLERPLINLKMIVKNQKFNATIKSYKVHFIKNEASYGNCLQVTRQIKSLIKANLSEQYPDASLTRGNIKYIAQQKPHAKCYICS